MKLMFLFSTLISALFCGYEPIDALAKKFNREFTTVVFGANDGHFSFDLASSYPLAKLILIEDNNPKSSALGDKLFEKINDLEIENKPIFLNKRITKEEFNLLSEIYHFDIVTFIGESFYNQQGEEGDLVNRLELMLNLSWHTFFQCRQNSSIDKILSNKNAIEVITLENQQKLYHFENKKTTLSRHHLFASVNQRTIHADFEKSIEIFETQRPTKYVILQRMQGLSLIDFKALYGSFPTKEMLEAQKNKLKLNTKQSMYPHELIVTSSGFKLISPHLPLKDYLPLSNTVFNELIKTKTTAEVKKLLN